tara:strand:+ start:3759 stop:4361 length:603 start_codon:yes stop_codon:yes gene_type:complete
MSNHYIIETRDGRNDLSVDFLGNSREVLQPILESAFTSADTTDRSGMKRTWVMDCRKGLSTTANLQAASDWFVSVLDSNDIDQIIVKGYGAYFLAGSIMTTSYKPISGAIMREKEKEYDLKNMIEGTLDVDKPILIVDDILNSGSSILSVIKALQNYNMKEKLIHCACLLSFSWGNGEINVSKRGIPKNQVYKAMEVNYK